MNSNIEYLILSIFFSQGVDPSDFFHPPLLELPAPQLFGSMPLFPGIPPTGHYGDISPLPLLPDDSTVPSPPPSPSLGLPLQSLPERVTMKKEPEVKVEATEEEEEEENLLRARLLQSIAHKRMEKIEVS